MTNKDIAEIIEDEVCDWYAAYLHAKSRIEYLCASGAPMSEGAIKKAGEACLGVRGRKLVPHLALSSSGVGE